jgi:hypothetical protein
MLSSIACVRLTRASQTLLGPNRSSVNMIPANEIERQLELLRADFATVQGEPFTHFYCPILLDDQPTELCRGHIVNQSIPNSSRAWIVQRKDVDGFFGSVCESKFAVVMGAQPTGLDEALASERLRKVIPFDVKINGRIVPHYEIHGHKASSHPAVKLHAADGTVLNLALKISDEEISSAGRLEVEMDCNIVPEAVAALLKSAHLTMFKMLGYKHLFSPGGYDIAKILQRFYLENRDRNRVEQVEAGRAYFDNLAGMVIPVKGYNHNLLKGTIDVGRLLVCIGSSGAWFAVGVPVRMNNRMSIVLMAPDAAENIDTYMEFISNMDKPAFRYKIIEYHNGRNGEPVCWKIDRRDPFTFDPGRAP